MKCKIDWVPLQIKVSWNFHAKCFVHSYWEGTRKQLKGNIFFNMVAFSPIYLGVPFTLLKNSIWKICNKRICYRQVHNTFIFTVIFKNIKIKIDIFWISVGSNANRYSSQAFIFKIQDIKSKKINCDHKKSILGLWNN